MHLAESLQQQVILVFYIQYLWEEKRKKLQVTRKVTLLWRWLLLWVALQMLELITTEFPFIKKVIFISGFHQLQITKTSFKAPKNGFHNFRVLGFITTSTNLQNLWLKCVCIMWSQIPNNKIPDNSEVNKGSQKCWTVRCLCSVLFLQEFLSIKRVQPESSYHPATSSQELTGSSH